MLLFISSVCRQGFCYKVFPKPHVFIQETIRGEQSSATLLSTISSTFSMFPELGDKYVQWCSWNTCTYILVDSFGRPYAIQLHMRTNGCSAVYPAKHEWYINMDRRSSAVRNCPNCVATWITDKKEL